MKGTDLLAGAFGAIGILVLGLGLGSLIEAGKWEAEIGNLDGVRGMDDQPRLQHRAVSAATFRLILDERQEALMGSSGATIAMDIQRRASEEIIVRDKYGLSRFDCRQMEIHGTGLMVIDNDKSARLVGRDGRCKIEEDLAR